MSFDLLVIGTVSIDTLHFAGKTAIVPGGAGLYTALAAAKAGANVTLFAPLPNPIPEVLNPISKSIKWIGPIISTEELPRLEIAHYGHGIAKLLNASWAGTSKLTTANIPLDISKFNYIHIAALETAQRQLDFLWTCRKFPNTKISVGTYAKIVYGEKTSVQKLFDEADFFFMNENEAKGLFGSTDNLLIDTKKLLFVTRGKEGALIIQNHSIIRIPGILVTELDPTGAGDTFCGATLAKLIYSLSPTDAANFGVQLAAQMIEAVGPTFLLT
ncbi:carbohydrate kinase family protein [Patescibacteria group bacterium]